MAFLTGYLTGAVGLRICVTLGRFLREFLRRFLTVEIRVNIQKSRMDSEHHSFIIHYIGCAICKSANFRIRIDKKRACCIKRKNRKLKIKHLIRRK